MNHELLSAEAERAVLGWILRLWYVDKDDPKQGKNMWVGGAAVSRADAVGQIRASVLIYDRHDIDHDETIGYVLDRKPDPALLTEYENGFSRGESIVIRPEVIAVVVDEDKLAL